MNVDAIKTVAVIGAGTMGHGIAQACAVSGYKVLLYDVQSSLISAGIASIKKNLQALVEKQKLSADESASAASRVVGVSDFKQLQAELVIEAVIEKLEVKQKLFAELESINDKTSILASNTSSIPITQIASVLKSPNRFAGLHFFNPAPIMKLVEVIKGSSTDQETVSCLFDFCKKISKQAVLAQDSPGFIVNRVARHFYVESLKTLEENVVSHGGIDRLLRSAGFKMGPFELMDLIGVDVNFSVTSCMYNSFHQDPKFRPSRIQQQKVDAGHHGRKTGKGFYDYKK
jgi:3-hydroxybutyryl-CoA dehydrogenase